MMSWRTHGWVMFSVLPHAGEVHVVARVGGQAIVGGVVHAAHRERRAHLVALGGVVVDHVEDHLEPGGVHGPHHHLELLHGVLEDAVAAVVRRRGEEGQRVVAPVIVQALLDQVAVVEEVVDRQHLDGRDARGRSGA